MPPRLLLWDTSLSNLKKKRRTEPRAALN